MLAAQSTSSPPLNQVTGFCLARPSGAAVYQAAGRVPHLANALCVILQQDAHGRGAHPFTLGDFYQCAAELGHEARVLLAEAEHHLPYCACGDLFHSTWERLRDICCCCAADLNLGHQLEDDINATAVAGEAL